MPAGTIVVSGSASVGVDRLDDGVAVDRQGDRLPQRRRGQGRGADVHPEEQLGLERREGVVAVLVDRLVVPAAGTSAQSTVAVLEGLVGRFQIVVGPQLDVLEADGRRPARSSARSPSSDDATDHAPLRSRSARSPSIVAVVDDRQHGARQDDGEHRERGGEPDADGARTGRGEAAHVLGLAVGEGPEALHRLEGERRPATSRRRP